MKEEKIHCFAPASIANLNVGFDCLGLSFGGLGDRLTLTKKNSGIKITKITGTTDNLPLEVEKNTSTIAIMALLEDKKITTGFEIEIHKGIPLGSGLGGSAASAVGAVFAANELLNQVATKEELFQYALKGEAFISGGVHGDNIAPCLYGGLTLCHPDDGGNLSVKQLPLPQSLYAIIIHQDIILETKSQRQGLKQKVGLKKHINQSMNMALFISSIYENDLSLLSYSLKDEIIEEQRSKSIPYFELMKDMAFKQKALAFGISGSGPSVFALFSDESLAGKFQSLMEKKSQDLNGKFLVLCSKLNQDGVKIIHYV